MSSGAAAAPSYESRCISTAVAAMVGDATGAAYEGKGPKAINAAHPDGLTSLIPSAHMGAYQFGERFGEYTDDTNSSLAILSSIADNNGVLRPGHAAYRHAKRWHDGLSAGLFYGYPDSAQRMMVATLEGRKTPHECATISFPDGSFANGAAMKAYPIALAFPTASKEAFREAVKASCAYSHVHPIGIDAAVVQAEAVRLAMKVGASFDGAAFLSALIDCAETDEMKTQLAKLSQTDAVRPVIPAASAPSSGGTTTAPPTPPPPPFSAVSADLYKDVVGVIGPKEMSFQIGGVAAVVTALACFLKARELGVMAVIAHAVALGGDTDTTASMAAACAGALCPAPQIAPEDGQPKGWCPDDVWRNLCSIATRPEWPQHGKEFCVRNARRVAALAQAGGGGGCSVEAAPWQKYVPSPEDTAWFHLGELTRKGQRMQQTPKETAGEVHDLLTAGAAVSSSSSAAEGKGSPLMPTTPAAKSQTLRGLVEAILGRGVLRDVKGALGTVLGRLPSQDDVGVTRADFQAAFDL